MCFLFERENVTNVMIGPITLFFTAVAAVAAAISAIVSAVQVRRTRIVQEKIEYRTKVSSTINAFNDLQEQVLDKMVSYKEDDIKIFLKGIVKVKLII